jgi:hypothetical protein
MQRESPYNRCLIQYRGWQVRAHERVSNCCHPTQPEQARKEALDIHTLGITTTVTGHMEHSMADVYQVLIEDPRNAEDEVWEHFVSLETSLEDIAKAVSILYPKASEVLIRVAEEP